MKEKLNGIVYIFPVMFYFALEALIVGLFINILWKFFLINNFGHLGYFQIVTIYWIIKMLFFDVFKLIAGFSSLSKKIYGNDDYKHNNEQFEE